MDAAERAELVLALESGGDDRDGKLKGLGISRATYYRWRKQYRSGGIAALERRAAGSKQRWNRLNEKEEEVVLEIARSHPELSPRLIAVKITDEQEFSVSESTVYRLLKERGLIEPRALEDMPAAKQWKHQTTAPDQIWQCDATNFFVVGWGYYKGIPVIDDYSRKILAFPVKPDETSFSIADAIEAALESARKEGHALKEKPLLLSDNGPGFWGNVLAQYLMFHGIRHIFGRPYHPQTQGKVESVNKKIKGKVNLLIYDSPSVLEAAVRATVEKHNATPHEALKNVSPNDIYAGRQKEILKRREEKKRLTLQRRKEYNLSRPPRPSKTKNAKVSQMV